MILKIAKEIPITIRIYIKEGVPANLFSSIKPTKLSTETKKF